MDYRDNRQRWAESHQVVHFYAGQWCTFTPALTVRTEPKALFEALKEHCVCPERIVMETGTQAGWLARELRRREMPVDVIDARPNSCCHEASAQQDGRGRRRSSGRYCTDGLLPPGDGVELSGAGGSGPSRGAVPFGSPAAGYGERDPGVSRLLGLRFPRGTADWWCGFGPELLSKVVYELIMRRRDPGVLHLRI